MSAIFIGRVVFLLITYFVLKIHSTKYVGVEGFFLLYPVNLFYMDEINFSQTILQLLSICDRKRSYLNIYCINYHVF